MPAERALADSRVRQAVLLAIDLDIFKCKAGGRTNSDGDARLGQNIESGLGDEARTEHKNP